MDTVTFPGEMAMPQCLMSAALWLGVQEYAGGRLATGESMGSLADDHRESFRTALRVFGRGYQEEVVQVPIWYEDTFIHWALRMMNIWVSIPNANRLVPGRPEQRSS